MEGTKIYSLLQASKSLFHFPFMLSPTLTISSTLWDRLSASPKKYIHLVMIATKPDIIKQAPLYNALKKRGEEVVLVHTGQHYDFNLSGGMLEEFGLEVDINLNISGAYYEKVAQIIDRLGGVLMHIKGLGKIPLPYIHGDTMTAMAAGNAAYGCNVGCVHNEAGIRTMTPKKEFFQKLLVETQNFASLPTPSSLQWWFDLHKDPKNFEKGSMEPTPEQFNTRCAEPASGIFLAPVELDKQFLREEGYPENRIFVVGNSVADATHDVETRLIASLPENSIFQKYPLLKDGVLRFCIHRRENCENEQRFRALFGAMKKCIEAGYPVLLISLHATESAIDRFGLRDEMDALKVQENFIYSEVWPYYSDVIAAMKVAKAVITDSGSMQEECNILGVPCVTLRFGSDRGESFFAGGNVIAPPTSAELVFAIVKKVVDEGLLKNAQKIYGENVSEKCVDRVLEVLNTGESVLRTEEERIFG